MSGGIDVTTVINQISKSYDVESIKAMNLSRETILNKDGEDKTAFYVACEIGKLEIAEYLYDLGSDINHQEKVCTLTTEREHAFAHRLREQPSAHRPLTSEQPLQRERAEQTQRDTPSCGSQSWQCQNRRDAS